MDGEREIFISSLIHTCMFAVVFVVIVRVIFVVVFFVVVVFVVVFFAVGPFCHCLRCL